MKHSRYKTALLALGIIAGQVSISHAQKREGKSRAEKVVVVDIKAIEAEISNVFKTVAMEISKIDMKEVGGAIEEIGREIGDVKVVVASDSENEPNPEGIDLKDTEVKSKSISKTYPVSQSDKLSISNQYGNVTVKTWNKKEIKVDVEIKAYESSNSAAERLLETVSISDLRQTDLISFKTVFDKSGNNWRRVINGREERRGVEVNYTVFMPSNNPLDVNNRYGSLTVSDFKGPVDLISSYGKLSAGALTNSANTVKVSYGSADIETFLNGNLSVSYGSLRLEHGDKMNASVKYSKAGIGRLTGGGNFDIAYSGGFSIDKIDRNVKSLLINSAYSGLTLGIDEDSNTDFDVTVSYGGFNYRSDQVSFKNNLTGKSAYSPTKTYTGTIGNGADSKITIKSRYGSVKFL